MFFSETTNGRGQNEVGARVKVTVILKNQSRNGHHTVVPLAHCCGFAYLRAP